MAQTTFSVRMDERGNYRRAGRRRRNAPESGEIQALRDFPGRDERGIERCLKLRCQICKLFRSGDFLADTFAHLHTANNFLTGPRDVARAITFPQDGFHGVFHAVRRVVHMKTIS